ncbi:cell adhesion molecule CEACAM21-like [Glossophaga mutica]
MGSSSVSTHRGLVQWQGLLLIVSLVNFGSKPTTAQLTVDSKNAIEGSDVYLRIRPKIPEAKGFLWYRGRTILDNKDHIAYLLVNPIRNERNSIDERIMVEDDGTLQLQEVTTEDSGIYTVVVQIQGCQNLIAHGRLDVYPVVSSVKLEASKTTVREKKDAVSMTCHSNAPYIQWLFNGTSLRLTERMSLSLYHTSLTIDPVQREDAGDYQCKAFNPRSSDKSAPLKLNVKLE